MKKALFSVLALLIFPLSVFAAEVPAVSSVTKVTVYQDRALVTRSASVKLEKGQNAIRFDGLPGALIEESLRAEGSSAVPVTLYGAEIKREYVAGEANPRVAVVMKELEALRDDMTALEKRREDLQGQRNFLNNVGNFSSVQIPKDIMTKSSTAAEWGGISQYLLESYTENNKSLLANEQAVRGKNKEIEAKQRELNDLYSGRGSEKKTALVNVDAGDAGVFSVELSYLVPQATWGISYDAKVYPAKKECALISYGNVRQWTGEDWRNVKVTLSSAKPSVGGRIPELYPWFVDIYQPVPMRGYANDGKEGKFERAKVAALQEPMMSLDASNAPAAEAPMKMAQAAVSQELGSVTYEIPAVMTVLSDNQLVKTTVQSDRFKAELDYETTPKLSPYAFIHSKVTNDKEHSIAGGDLSVFVDDNYIARSHIPTIGRDEKFDLYLGIDEEVKVKRTELKDKQKDTMLGLKKRRDYSYKIEIENYKKEKIKVVLNDQMPVSKNADIKVELASSTTKVSETKDLGALKWEFELGPAAKKEIIFSFSVEYPADKTISGI